MNQWTVLSSDFFRFYATDGLLKLLSQVQWKCVKRERKYASQ